MRNKIITLSKWRLPGKNLVSRSQFFRIREICNFISSLVTSCFMSTDKLFKEAEKIIPFKRILPFLILLFLIGIGMIVSVIFKSMSQNQAFYKTRLNGIVNEIEQRPKENYYKIESEWYLIKHEIIDEIALGDSIDKIENSNILVLFDDQSNLKWHGEVKGVTFSKIDSTSIP